MITPSLQEACVAGVVRNVLLQLVHEKGGQVSESTVTVQDLLEADEVFLTDVIHGIRWVGAFRNKRYFHTYSKQLLQSLNDLQQKQN